MKKEGTEMRLGDNRGDGRQAMGAVNAPECMVAAQLPA